MRKERDVKDAVKKAAGRSIDEFRNTCDKGTIIPPRGGHNPAQTWMPLCVGCEK